MSRQAPLSFRVGHAYRRQGEAVEQVLARASEDLRDAQGRDEQEDRRST